jgi:pimeloyl-ACP methyl ester carboxylesterase
MSTTTSFSRSIVESSVELPDGSRIHYARSGPFDGPTVFFVHGWPDSWVSFRPVMEQLPEHVHAVAISLPGFGGSDPIAGPARPSDMARAVVAVADRLEISSAVFVGHSMGTLVCQRVTEIRPGLVSGLVLIGAFVNLPVEVGDELGAVVSGFTDPMDEEFVREFQAGTLATPVPDELFEALVAESMRAPAAVWQSAVAGMRVEQGRDPSSIGVPTLLIWGDQDSLALRDQQDVLLTAIARSRLEVYTGAGHSPNWEQPARVAGDVMSIVEERSTR